ncbi:hypothetical protein ACIBG0_36780 [Nocardia sp. NPDC050630]
MTSAGRNKIDTTNGAAGVRAEVPEPEETLTSISEGALSISVRAAAF